ncbi:hypothetical protein DPMN_092164 [Dreissena polymorpha]|uniref:Uncharacterized protein n=1 Tax=Dreissena polymorpha TaxID=45954 RepID=A0A9D4L1G3_DREPO|nr:hypothetical protein DPMN_092164 [Dreissena polymorpha]
MFDPVGAPGLVMGPCIVEVNRIVIRDVQYQFEVNRCRYEKVNFQGSSANRRTAEITTISPCFSKSFAHLRGTNILVNSHVIQLTGTIFNSTLVSRKHHVLSKFHENWAKNVTSTVEKCPATGGHVFSPIPTIFKLVRDINKINVLTTFHDDWAQIVTSRVFTRKTAPPTGGHVFQWIKTTFELNQDNIKTNFRTRQRFIGTKLLTKFHEDRTRNVASRVFMSKS